jgi:hypothetical protein
MNFFHAHLWWHHFSRTSKKEKNETLAATSRCMVKTRDVTVVLNV